MTGARRWMRARMAAAAPTLLGVWLLLAVPVVLGFVVAYRFVGAPPPRHVRLAAGTTDGAYYQFGQQYARILAADGITLEVIPTAGSVENLSRLASGDVSLALVQGGSASETDRAQLQSLGGLFAEPLWVFTSERASIRRLNELEGKRVAVGAPGSGTHLLATQILAANGVSASNASLIPEEAPDVKALSDHSLDAAIFVASPDAAFVRPFLETPGVELLDIGRTTAYSRRFAFLIPVILHEGVVDLARNIPPRDTRLVATVAHLAARTDLNVSLIPALLNAVTRVHKGEGLLASDRTFPSAEEADLPMNEDAARYIQQGPSFLYRWLPYRTAVLLDRLKVLALPFVALLLPLFKVGPLLYQWRVRSRIYRWYADVRAIDAELDEPAADRDGLRRQLDDLEHEVAAVSVPLAYAGELYHLRLHIRFLQERLNPPDQPATTLPHPRPAVSPAAGRRMSHR